MTSSLLIDEPPLQVLPSLAVQIGLDEAIFLQQIHYWLKIKQTDPTRYADSYQQGRWWVYNSVPEWHEQFPFWPIRTIERILASLRTQGVLRVERLAHDKWDRTNWYTIDSERLQALAPPPTPAEGAPPEEETPSRQNGEMHAAKAAESTPPKWKTPSRQNGGIHPATSAASLISETSSKTTQRVLQKAAAPPRVLPSASGEKITEKNRDKSGDKTDQQRQVYQQGTRNLKVALEKARKKGEGTPSPYASSPIPRYPTNHRHGDRGGAAAGGRQQGPDPAV